MRSSRAEERHRRTTPGMARRRCHTIRQQASTRRERASTRMRRSSGSSPPTVSITAPIDGWTVSGTATVAADAADNIGVAGVQFKADGSNLGAEVTLAPYAVNWNTTVVTNGTHSVWAVVRDAAGNS